MASRKRKLQEDAAPPNPVSDEPTKLSEFALHLALRIQAANRLGLQKVRLDMFDMETALALADALTEAINAQNRQRGIPVPRSGAGSR